MLRDSASVAERGLTEEYPPERNDTVSFGPFRLCRTQRRLEKEGVPIRLGSRALDLLVVLVERAHEVVGKRELLAKVWPNLVVDEGSLRFHIASLRKVLGDGQSGIRYVTNVAGRGYCFVAPIARSQGTTQLSERLVTDQAARLPTRPSRMLGRDEAAQQISTQLQERRLVTVVGPGGIGKTTVSVSVAHDMVADFGGAVLFVDLGALDDPLLVPVTLASALGLVVSSECPIQAVLSFLRDQRMLLVLDSCEHVIETVATVAERIFNDASQVHILATSREPLRIEGEQIYPLPPLAFPSDSAGLTAAEALSYPAVRLFVERVAATRSQFALNDTEAPIVADICRRLDGIALALELAAGRVPALGISETAALLDNQFRLFWQGRRTAPPRHQTLGATLDWSHSLLSELERLVLHRLAVFVGPFSLEAACSVAGGDPIDRGHVMEGVASLVAKCLIAAEVDITPVRYRLLDTTRAYALGKLIRSGEETAVALRHATYYRELLDRTDSAVARWSSPPSAAVHREHVSNIRAALEWSFSAQGDLDLGTALAAGSAPLFLEMSLMSECRRWMERSMAARDTVAWGAERETEIQAALALSLMLTEGDCQKVRAALARALELAEQLGPALLQMRLLSALHVFLTTTGDLRGALAFARRSEVVAREIPDPAAMLAANWMLGVSYHLMGPQCRAREHCESVLHPLARQRGGLMYCLRIRALGALARVLWLQGDADQALKVARQTLDEADSRGHPIGLSYCLINVASVFLWIGDSPAAGDIIERLIAHANRHSLPLFQAVGVGLKGELSLKCGDVDGGIRLLRTCLEALGAKMVFAGALAEGLAMAGQLDEAMAVIGEAIDHGERNGESFHTPEVLRIKGELLAAAPGADLSEAEDWLSRSLRLARGQSALALELRTATSLALVRRKQDRHREAHDVLAAAYERFTEGFETADLKAARRLLDELQVVTP